MVDISSVGTRAVLVLGGANPEAPRTITIDEWSDEGTPFSIGVGTQMTNSKKNINGNMVSSRNPAIVNATISLIPDSEADIEIRELLINGVLTPENAADVASITVTSLTFTIPKNDKSSHNPTDVYTITLTNGRFDDPDIGASTNDEGRKQAKNYSFHFESLSISDSQIEPGL